MTASQRGGRQGQCPPLPPKTQTPTKTKTPSHNSNVPITRYRAFSRWGGQCPPVPPYSKTATTSPSDRVRPPTRVDRSIRRLDACARLRPFLDLRNDREAERLEAATTPDSGPAWYQLRYRGLLRG
jgi:hypothetical protein